MIIGLKILQQISFLRFQVKLPHFFVVFPYTGLQSELYDISRAVATSKQVDVKLTSFKAVRLSPGSALPDTSFLYVNQVSVFGMGLPAIEIPRVASGVLSIVKEYLGTLIWG